MRSLILAALAWGTACGGAPADPALVELANRLYLDGDWAWVDSMRYDGYVPAGANTPHFGWYIVSGSATLETVDSTDVETYALTATAQIFHVDSVGTTESVTWVVQDIEYEDTVTVENDSIFRLSVEPIPPAAGANTNSVRWVFDSDQLWCTNWLRDSVPEGNADNCSTSITWSRQGSNSSGRLAGR